VLGGAYVKISLMTAQSPSDEAKCNGLLLWMSRSVASIGCHRSSKETISTKKMKHLNFQKKKKTRLNIS
jgi:hypothetical protein